MLVFIVGVCMLAAGSAANNEDTDRAAVEAVVESIYKTISFEPGGEPDWAGFRALMAPGAILTPVRQGGLMSVEDFIARFQEAITVADNPFAARGFIERQLHAVTEIYSGVAHVFSTYETTYADGVMIGRGINSIQLARIEGAWRIVSIAWDDEFSGEKIPSEYLGKK